MIYYLLLYSLWVIWGVIFINVILVISGYVYYRKIHNKKMKEELEYYPFVTVMVPSHNEGLVIKKTAESLLRLDYPEDRYEIIIINDNSSDNSAEILKSVKDKHKGRNFKVVNTDSKTGGKGKSNALNMAFNISKGEYITIYDADNTPEPKALKYLVQTIEEDDKLAAVIGKFRCRNKHVNLLTAFINIETLSFQWMAQAGRWQLFNLCTIPGTNFIIRRKLIEKIGGWDTKAITEDTEISFRLYRMGYKIKFMPLAVTWEQEPQTLKVWFRQRSRWAKGNIYVVLKNIKYIFMKDSGVIRFDIMYYVTIYFLFLSANLISDLIFILSLFGVVQIYIQGYIVGIWIIALAVFTLSILLCVSTENGEFTFKNFIVILLMYFTYCKLWSIVAAYGFYNFIKDTILKKEAKWYKTERFK